MLVSNAYLPRASTIEALSQLAWRQKKAIIHRGITWSQYQQVKKEMRFTDPVFIRLLGIDRGQLSIYRPKGRFPATPSDKFLAFIDLFDFGLTIFPNRAKFLNWLQLPNELLKKERPLDALQYSSGIQEVRIALDVYAHNITM